MKLLKKRILSCLLIIVLILPMIPTTIFAADEPVQVNDWFELVNAIEAIPEGGKGEISIKYGYFHMGSGLEIENKDVVFYLESAQLITTQEPVICAKNSNISIIADENSLMESQGSTSGKGTICVESSTNDKFELTINGGKYGCIENDNVLNVGSGVKAKLTNVLCRGPLNTNGDGAIEIHSGKFANDIREYVVDGKFTCNVEHSYYVRDTEFTDEFKQILTDGKLVFDYAKPDDNETAIWLLSEEFNMANPNFYLMEDDFFEDYNKCELVMYPDSAKEEIHVVDVVWNYDGKVYAAAKNFVSKFPDNKEYFEITDLELINYWTFSNHEQDDEMGLDTLASYSSELKTYLGNTNFILPIENRAGADELFFTTRKGSAKLTHDGIAYYSFEAIGAKAEHAIHVPANTASTKDALAAAAQKRIDDYIGKDVVKLTITNETVTEYYNNEIAYYDNIIATAQRELPIVQAAYDALPDTPENSALRSQYLLQIRDYQWKIDSTPDMKKYFIDSFAEGGELEFLKKAEGDFIFDIKVKDQEYKCIIVKDDNKLTIPSYKTVDVNTDVQVKTDSSSVPLDTIIEVEKLTDGKEYEEIMKVLDIKKNETFDIKLHSNSLDGYVTKLKDGKFEVRIPIPESFDKESLAVYYVDDKDKKIEHEVTVKENYAVFTTNHFSIYTLAEKTNANAGSIGSSSSVPLTGDYHPTSVFFILMLVSSAIIAGAVVERKRKIK